ncbi:MAG: 30S ribosomal protein S7 [Chloroflexi bacterium]|nr:30S ribosomal protein S7 [Chloroflexota bacterium]MDA1269888.1 30S ribosomal protein S7 [Chloroflexota bacterium]PKB59485.1 MAG: 30S ribosomal protein S7 [SAR202 cluster bacterium Casp-Chloro-G2]
MSRRRAAEKREIAPDPRFNDVELARFINRVMIKGKKSIAQRITYSAFDIIQAESNREPLEVFQQALRNATPAVEVKPKRIGGSTIQVPTELRATRSEALAMRWIIRGARARNGMPMMRGLAQELMDASRGEGSAVRRREELHRMAEANRAFVHYRR